jgi:two-component system chemotaxis sensor kinase CheA
MDDFEKELLLDFFAEANQLLSESEQAFLALEKDKNNKDLIHEIFRLTHTMKGSSRAVGLGDVAEFTHETENLILQLRDGHLEITSAVITLLLECNDYVKAMIDALQEDLEAKFDSTVMITRIKKALPPAPPKTAKK